MVCRSSRQEYDERVCLASVSDGVLQSVEYRLLVEESLSQGRLSLFLQCRKEKVDETCFH